MKRMLDFSWLKSIFPQFASDGRINGTANGNIPIVSAADLGTLTLQQTVAKYGNIFVTKNVGVLPCILICNDTGTQYNCAMFNSSAPDLYSMCNGILPYITLNNINLSSALGVYASRPITFDNTTSIVAGLGGTPSYAVAHSTLHIHGTFTPTETIASGTKLFSTGQTLAAKMTHGSAINTGSAGSEAFVGISIQTNGDVYCLGALTSGVTYSIAVTATL